MRSLLPPYCRPKPFADPFRDLSSPFFDAELAKKAPLPTEDGPRLATFISNCGGGSRNRLITDLVKEGIIFDHYGKCKEDVFGGAPQVSIDESPPLSRETGRSRA